MSHREVLCIGGEVRLFVSVFNPRVGGLFHSALIQFPFFFWHIFFGKLVILSCAIIIDVFYTHLQVHNDM